MKEKLIRKFEEEGNECKLYYKEIINEETKEVIIETKMTFDLTSKKAKKELNKSWEQDKSPLLTKLKEIFRNHERAKTEEKEGTWYTKIE